jgi:predicted HicB family RNase H-like nuclease
LRDEKVKKKTFLIRSDTKLHRTLKAEARRAERSLNAEVLWRLRQSLEQQPSDAAAA